MSGHLAFLLSVLALGLSIITLLDTFIGKEKKEREREIGPIGLFMVLFGVSCGLVVFGVLAGSPIEAQKLATFLTKFLARMFPGYIGSLCIGSVAPIGLGIRQVSGDGLNPPKIVLGVSLFGQVVFGGFLLAPYLQALVL